MIVFVTWIWGSKYGAHYIARLRNGVDRHFAGRYIFKVVEPLPSDDNLLAGCLCRLRMFSPAWQQENGIMIGDTVISLDLDLIITGRLNDLFMRPEDFVILSGANASNPCPYNGSVMMLRAGRHQEVWGEFSLEAASKAPYYEFPDDQGWIWHKLPMAATWPVGPASGIYAFRKPQWPRGDLLPKDAKIVAFPGRRDPAQFATLPWIHEHWVRQSESATT